MSLKIILQGFYKLSHGEVLMFEYMIFQSGHGVGHCTDPDPLNVVGVVPGAACVIIPGLINTIQGDGREEGDRHLLSEDGVNDVGAGDFDVQEMFNLLSESGHQLFEALEAFSFPCVKT